MEQMKYNKDYFEKLITNKNLKNTTSRKDAVIL
jgi:hypothetical protein